MYVCCSFRRASAFVCGYSASADGSDQHHCSRTAARAYRLTLARPSARRRPLCGCGCGCGCGCAGVECRGCDVGHDRGAAHRIYEVLCRCGHRQRRICGRYNLHNPSHSILTHTTHGWCGAASVCLCLCLCLCCVQPKKRPLFFVSPVCRRTCWVRCGVWQTSTQTRGTPHVPCPLRLAAFWWLSAEWCVNGWCGVWCEQIATRRVRHRHASDHEIHQNQAVATAQTARCFGLPPQQQHSAGRSASPARRRSGCEAQRTAHFGKQLCH